MGVPGFRTSTRTLVARIGLVLHHGDERVSFHARFDTSRPINDDCPDRALGRAGSNPFLLCF